MNLHPSAIFVAAASLVFSASSATPAPMLDLATDDPGREWCYLAKSTTVIALQQPTTGLIDAPVEIAPLRQ